jgi:uncharacterized membrane protein
MPDTKYMAETLLYTLYWWFIFLLLSLTFYPVSQVVFKNLVDRGWFAAKVIGLLILAFTSYILGVFHLLPFSLETTWGVLIVWFVLIHLINYRLKGRPKLDRVWLKKATFIEIVFFSLFFFMAIIRGFQPQINGLEKYMDFGFIMAALNGDYFPPKDMWWAGGYLNYYYFGHLWAAWIIKLTSIPAAVGFNLVLALCFAFSGSLLIEFLWSWTRRLWPAFLGAFMHLGIGNLHFLTTVWQKGWNYYWYPDASRLIYHVITEFPVYSFVVYDLHAHVLNFGPDLLVIGFIGEIFRSKRFGWYEAVLMGFLLGLNFLSNAWDLPVYFMVFGLMMILFAIYDVRSKKRFIDLVKNNLLMVVIIALVIAPFWYFFDKLSLPILPTSTHSPPYQLFQLWGFWFFLTVSFAIFLWFIRRKIEYFDYLICVLMVGGWLLIIIPEFVFVKDIYGVDYERANTVFKLSFQSWNLFAMGGGYIVWRLVTAQASLRAEVVKLVWMLVFAGLLAGCAAYTVRAYKSGYGDFQNYSGIDGEAFLAQTYSPSDYEAIKWIRANTPKDSVVVEAAGDSYTEYQRVSSFTGRETIVGWAVHEWLWRGSFDPVGARQTDVIQIYTTMDDTEFDKLVRKYSVDYVYMSNLETVKYNPPSGTALRRNSQVVFQSGGVEILKVN